MPCRAALPGSAFLRRSCTTDGDAVKESIGVDPGNLGALNASTSHAIVETPHHSSRRCQFGCRSPPGRQARKRRLQNERGKEECDVFDVFLDGIFVVFLVLVPIHSIRECRPSYPSFLPRNVNRKPAAITIMVESNKTS